MLLRTSSNPISQALLPQSINAAATACSAGSPGAAPTASPSRRQISCAKSNMGSAKFNRKPRAGNLGEFRRALSDSNLEDLASPGGLSSAFSASCSSFSPHFQKVSEGPRNGKKLETAPSFGIYHAGDGFDLEELEQERKNKNGESGLLVAGGEDGGLERTVTIGELIESIDAVDFSFGKPDMGLIVEEEGEGENEDEVFDPSASPPMYLAAGLGADVIAGGDLPLNFDDGEDAEACYRNLIAEFPNHPLLLRNYAELLKSKGDLQGAGEYYFRATLADPEDGEVLSQYAKLVWEVYHDQERAGEYFERAAKVSSQDSNVLAAWASFLWETATESSETQDHVQSKEGANLGAEGQKEGPSVEEYSRRLVEQNPSNALVLRNYAYFLYKSNGDLRGAEEYYSRAILADPGDGEILTQYANLVWELHKDEDKAQSYFKRAAQAAPADSHVLAAYANFLWATDGDKDEQEDEPILIPSVCLPQVALQA